MNRPITRALSAALVGAALVAAAAVNEAAAQVSAEPWVAPRTFNFTAEIGGAAFSDFQRSQARPVPAIVGVTDFQRRVSARTSMTVGASATYWIGRGWGLRVGGAFIPTRFSVWNEEDAERRMDAYPLDQEQAFAALGVWLGTAAVTFRFPATFGRVLPYGVIGAGAVHYRVRDDDVLPPEARERFASGSHSTPAAVLGIGATLPLQREGMLLDFQLTNHLAGSPLTDTGRGQQFYMSGVPVELQPDSGSSGTDGIDMTSNLRLTVGVTLAVTARR